MSTETHETNNAQGHGGFERRDIGAAGILYFLAGLAAATLLIIFILDGLYSFLDKRERAQQPAVSPLITNVPADTRPIAPNYPEKAFPDPRLETDERNQLNKIRLDEEQTLATYGWIDEKTGTVRIPIERAMDLVAQRGLPTRPQDAASQPPTTKKGNK
jgi:hypothetical protein